VRGLTGPNSSKQIVAASSFLPQGRGLRHLTPSPSSMRRTWLRPTVIPRSRAVAARAYSVQWASFSLSLASNSQPAARASQSGGSVATNATICERSVSVSRGCVGCVRHPGDRQSRRTLRR
jgi:hypothetical protein